MLAPWNLPVQFSLPFNGFYLFLQANQWRTSNEYSQSIPGEERRKKNILIIIINNKQLGYVYHSRTGINACKEQEVPGVLTRGVFITLIR